MSILLFITFYVIPVQLTRNPWCGHISIKKREIICQDFSEQSLEEIPLNIQDNVTDINLKGNFIKIVKSGAFKGLQYLQQIDLERNDISEIQEGAFEGIQSKIEHLTLMNNKLKKLEAKMWRGLKKIDYLDLTSNKLTHISYNCFGPDLDVNELTLSYNKIISIAPDTFKSMRLSFLSLYMNQLEWVPCFQNIQDDHQMTGKPDSKRKVLEMSILGSNPLRCQPCYCWAILGSNPLRCQPCYCWAILGSNPLRCQPCYCWAPVNDTFDCGSPWGPLPADSNRKLKPMCRDLSSVMNNRLGFFHGYRPMSRWFSIC